MLTQDYKADINIMPSRWFFDPTILLAALSDHDATSLADEGERATWPRIEIIRNCTKISRCIEELRMRSEDRCALDAAIPA